MTAEVLADLVLMPKKYRIEEFMKRYGGQEGSQEYDEARRILGINHSDIAIFEEHGVVLAEH